jgi:hypothetical protein
VRDDAFGGRVGFEVDGETLRVRDELEGDELRLVLDREVHPRPALTELFPFPVDEAVSFEASSFSVPEYSSVRVRSDDGDFIARLDDPMELPRGSYCFDLSGATKTFIRVADVSPSTTGAVDSGPVDVEFDRQTTVSVGARSRHTRPEATITVPDDPTALVAAVSVLGSSIREFSPERSWPTLRGYPPRILRGDELDIPSPLTRPETGVEVVVRPEYADVYRLSTLSYYLGARMTVGDAPAVRLETGYVEPLPTEGVALERRAEELLRTWFFLDTLARTDGYVPSNRYEYERVGPELPFYPPNLADLSMSERLMEYLEIDPETVAPYMPDWPTKAVLRPGPASAELLPHLAHVLAPVRVRGAAEVTDSEKPVALATSPWLTPGHELPSPDDDPLPAGVSVLTPAGYENQLRRESTARGEIHAVALVASSERATAVRRALSEPAVPQGVGEWEVLDRPSAETVAAVLSDSEVDVAYCGLPVAEGEVAAADGAVTLANLDDASALTIFEGADDVCGGLQVVENGGMGSIVAAQRLDRQLIRWLVALLSVSIPVDASVSLSGISDKTDVRCVCCPAASVTSDQILSKHADYFTSQSPTSYRLRRRSILTQSGRIGTEVSQVFDGSSDLSELAGTEHNAASAFDPSQILTFLHEEDSVVKLDGRLLLPSDDLTEADIERLAGRNLAERGDGETSGTDRTERRRGE